MLFQQVLDKRIEQAKIVLVEKAKEYAHSNRYHNFIVAATLVDKESTPKQTLMGMVLKHLTSVVDILDGNLSQDKYDEKFGDVFNYMIILMGMCIFEQDLSNILSENFHKNFKAQDLSTKIDITWDKKHLKGQWFKVCTDLDKAVNERRYDILLKTIEVIACAILIEGVMLSHVNQSTGV